MPHPPKETNHARESGNLFRVSAFFILNCVLCIFRQTIRPSLSGVCPKPGPRSGLWRGHIPFSLPGTMPGRSSAQNLSPGHPAVPSLRAIPFF